jgi:hypothetical protein
MISQGSDFKQTDIRTLLSWVSEAQAAHSEWRAQSWNDYEFRDAHHWSEASYKKLLDKGIAPLTINRIFPVINLIHGHFIRNQQDIIAKGRTKDDSELAQVMSEAFAMVKDQNKGAELITSAFSDEIITGYGCLEVGKHYDPRCEPVQWTRHPWYSSWWDPYASPWDGKENCRYRFTAAWKNIEDIIQAFPQKQQEIIEKFGQLSSDYYVPDVDDVGTIIEDHHKYLSSNHWINSDRKRVRPVQMWYTVLCKSLFAVMPDSQVIDVDALKSPSDQMSAMQYATELIPACVKKTRVATFISDLLLQDIPSPYSHDEYPFVPFIGYLDRFNQPFGIPRQIKDQAMEVNKRRSMALSLISNRRVIIEEDAAKDINKVYSEANRQDGLIVLKKGRRGSFEIQEMSALATPQVDMMLQSEREIQEIAGANDEALSSGSALQSGVALDKKQQLSSTVTASLLHNAMLSQKRLGELTMAMVKDTWTGPKVLRVTDRLSGSEKFVEINKRVYDADLGGITIQNSISDGNFDIVVAAAPLTDTMREKNMELLFGAINKAPPEAIGPLLNLAFEISDLPNKDALLKQIRQATGVPDPHADLPNAEREMLKQQEQMQKEQQQQLQQQKDEEDRQLAHADTKSKITERLANADARRRDVERDDWEAGAKLGNEILKAQTVKPTEAKSE